MRPLLLAGAIHVGKQQWQGPPRPLSHLRRRAVPPWVAVASIPPPRQWLIGASPVDFELFLMRGTAAMAGWDTTPTKMARVDYAMVFH
jgi:hypothetical protein